jgi:hypothetical protein
MDKEDRKSVFQYVEENKVRLERLQEKQRATNTLQTRVVSVVGPKKKPKVAPEDYENVSAAKKESKKRLAKGEELIDDDDAKGGKRSYRLQQQQSQQQSQKAKNKGGKKK